jgi:hypothetical protein
VKVRELEYAEFCAEIAKYDHRLVGSVILTSGGGFTGGVIGAGAWISNALGWPPKLLRWRFCMSHVATLGWGTVLLESTTMQTQRDLHLNRVVRGVSGVSATARVWDLLESGRRVYLRQRKRVWTPMERERAKARFEGLRGRPYEKFNLPGGLRLAGAELFDHVFQTRGAREENIICSELSTILEEAAVERDLRNQNETSPTDFITNWDHTYDYELRRIRWNSSG